MGNMKDLRPHQVLQERAVNFPKFSAPWWIILRGTTFSFHPYKRVLKPQSTQVISPFLPQFHPVCSISFLSLADLFLPLMFTLFWEKNKLCLDKQHIFIKQA